MKANQPKDVWKYVATRAPDECWLWQGYIRSDGYGKFRLNGKYLTAHRAAYIAANGQVLDGLEILHKCNMKACCNPSHLTASTSALNQLHYSLTTGVAVKSNTGIKGVSYNHTRKQYQVNSSTGFLYRGPSIFGAWAARLEHEIQVIQALNNQGIFV